LKLSSVYRFPQRRRKRQSREKSLILRKIERECDMMISGDVVEAGCHTVIGQRLKQSGMYWTVKGANNIIALRCCILSGRWEDFWEYRVPAYIWYP